MQHSRGGEERQADCKFIRAVNMKMAERRSKLRNAEAGDFFFCHIFALENLVDNYNSGRDGDNDDNNNNNRCHYYLFISVIIVLIIKRCKKIITANNNLVMKADGGGCGEGGKER